MKDGRNKLILFPSMGKSTCFKWICRGACSDRVTVYMKNANKNFHCIFKSGISLFLKKYTRNQYIKQGGQNCLILTSEWF